MLVASGSTTADENAGATCFTAKPHRSTVQKYSQWMSRFADDTLLSQMSLPGTHDSCALHDGLSFGFAKCQTWPLADQLKAGIRFLDIRCRHLNNRFAIYHGVINQKMTFQEVRDVCHEFLRAHPSECIVMSVKEESSAKNNSRSFAETFADSIKNDGPLWHRSRHIPELRAVRGRIVLIDRVGTLGGIPWGTLERQDRFNAPLTLKSRLIRSHFQKASKAKKTQWFVNFCSGTLPGKLMTPRKYAVQSNQVALEFLRRANGRAPARLGTVVMDFPGEELLKRIVESNFTNGPQRSSGQRAKSRPRSP